VIAVVERAPRPPALEVAVAHALVSRVNEGSVDALVSRVDQGSVDALVSRVDQGSGDALVRLYRPAPTVAFGRLDRLRPGFAAAVAAARAHGFEPVLRAPGGHAVAYHEGCLGIDELLGEADPIAGMHDRFARSGARLAGALRSLGVDARVGPVPREFCPGEFTVNARGALKLVGTAQRVVRHASLLAASVAVSGAERLRAVLVDVYAALELDWDPATVGAVGDEVAVGLDDVEAAVLAAYDPPRFVALDAATLALAEELEPQHRL
jgi:octanoyl-[GcvH]:protein N-octanoyltransferase